MRGFNHPLLKRNSLGLCGAVPSVGCVATLSLHEKSQLVRGVGGGQGRRETLGHGGSGLACSCVRPSYIFASSRPFLPSARLSPRSSTCIRALERENAFPFAAGSIKFSSRNNLIATASGQEKIMQLIKTRNRCEVTNQGSNIQQTAGFTGRHNVLRTNLRRRYRYPLCVSIPVSRLQLPQFQVEYPSKR
jgi:hypothetical protein